MASLRKKQRGTWLARWRDAKGEPVEVATGEYSMERAQVKANKLEAEHKFWEDVETFRAYAALNYSPRYCHDAFIAAKHLRFDRFRQLLDEAGVVFADPQHWRDTKKTSSRGKKYKYQGQMLTVAQIVEQSGCGLSEQALRHRLDQGMSADEATTAALMSRSEAGKKGGRK